MNAEVTRFTEGLKEPWQAQMSRELREIVHRSIPEVQERIQYGKPHFLKGGKYASVISTSKDAVSFTIFSAKELELPEGMFDGPPERKTIKFRNGQTPDAELLTGLLTQASSSL